MLQVQEKYAQSELEMALNLQESFWKEKAKVNWFKHGDRNTAYFHKIARIRQVSNHMSSLIKGDQILNSNAEAENHVLEYYTSLYATENDCVSTDIIAKVIPEIVSIVDNAMLTNLPSFEEVKNAVFSMNPSGSPGPDGFGGCLYKKYWEIIGHDVFNSVLQFFTQSWLLPDLNSNLVVLIPKFKGADKIEDFRPIALANYQFKIITKVLADRLAIIAPKIISEEQRGFIKVDRFQNVFALLRKQLTCWIPNPLVVM